MSALSLVRLLQLSSPALPVGAYSYSQGLESAIEAGIVVDEKTAQQWIGDVLRFSVATMDAPVLHRMLVEPQRMEELNALFLATRETSELLAETRQMGGSLFTLLKDLGLKERAIDEVSFPAAFAIAAAHWSIPPHDALVAYLWAWSRGRSWLR